MKKKKKVGLISSQTSVWFSSDITETDPVLNKKAAYYYLAETSMLVDDVKLRILPFPDNSEKRYKVKLVASEPECQDLVMDAVDVKYSRGYLTDSIYHFYEQCVRVLMVYGYAGYEIVYFSTEDGKLDSFRLALIPPSALIVSKNSFQQYVPQQIASERKLKNQFIELPSENILLFELPEYIKPHHKQIMESLAVLAGNLFPKFFLENMYRPKFLFSQPDYLLAREIALTKVTQVIGWNARKYDSEYKSDFYVWYRQLIFYKFLCSLRETILNTLNEGLRRVGNKMDFNAELSFEGLPTVEDAENALQKYCKGEFASFRDALKIFE